MTFCIIIVVNLYNNVALDKTLKLVRTKSQDDTSLRQIKTKCEDSIELFMFGFQYGIEFMCFSPAFHYIFMEEIERNTKHQASSRVTQVEGTPPSFRNIIIYKVYINSQITQKL